MKELNFNKEYAIWGVPPGKNDDDLLYTEIKSYQTALNIIKILESEHGCRSCHIQTIDFNEDLSDTFRRLVQG